MVRPQARGRVLGTTTVRARGDRSAPHPGRLPQGAAAAERSQGHREARRPRRRPRVVVWCSYTHASDRGGNALDERDRPVAPHRSARAARPREVHPAARGRLREAARRNVALVCRPEGDDDRRCQSLRRPGHHRGDPLGRREWPRQPKAAENPGRTLTHGARGAQARKDGWPTRASRRGGICASPPGAARRGSAAGNGWRRRATPPRPEVDLGNLNGRASQRWRRTPRFMRNRAEIFEPTRMTRSTAYPATADGRESRVTIATG